MQILLILKLFLHILKVGAEKKAPTPINLTQKKDFKGYQFMKHRDSETQSFILNSLSAKNKISVSLSLCVHIYNFILYLSFGKVR